MDFRFTEEQIKLRQEVREFLAVTSPERFPCQIRDEGYGFGGWSFEFSRELAKKGWLGIPWPKEYGGLGMPLMNMFVVKDELAYHGAPTMAHFFNDSMGLSFLVHGHEEQKKSFLPRMARGEIFFCTGLSEPNAGCDLLGLQMKARPLGDDFILSGQKIWTTGAFLADWSLMAVQTDPQAPRPKRISTFLVDLKSPGCTVRPLVDMTGNQSLSEMFFDEVKVPRRNLLGPLHAGFQLVLESLEGDRFWGRCVRASGTRRNLEKMIAYCRETKHRGIPLSEDALIRHQLADLAVEIEVCRALTYRCLSLLDKGVTLTHEASVLKTFADELGQRAARLWMQILGPAGQLWKDNEGLTIHEQVAHEYLFAPALTIAGGTSEIQRNTIALRGLGLPRE
jgi:alkylation response protein AidB-like acyl-CoA dehydrogenase